MRISAKTGIYVMTIALALNAAEHCSTLTTLASRKGRNVPPWKSDKKAHLSCTQCDLSLSSREFYSVKTRTIRSGVAEL